MSRKHLLLGGALLPSIALFVACSSGGGGDPSVSTEDITANYVAMAYASYSDSLSTAQALQAAVDTFTANPTEANLLVARNAYKATRVPYQQSEIMRFDTAYTIDFDLAADGGPASVDDWEGQVNAWPLDENFIVGIIEGSMTIDRDLLLAQNGAGGEANVTTGVHAVEFMLWGPDLNGTGPGAGERPASDYANDGSCADLFCERRALYLETAMDLLVDDLQEMTAEWSPEAANTQGTLAYNVMFNNRALDYILGSMNAMATDELASARMGSGLELGDPEEEHDCFSDLSHVAIYNNFQGVRNAFYGSYGSVSGPSLGDLVKSKSTDTYFTIDSAFNSIEEKMAYILDLGELPTNPLRFDQIIGQPADGADRLIAEEAVSELIALGALFEDVQELLSLQEISTDGSGDGD